MNKYHPTTDEIMQMRKDMEEKVQAMFRMIIVEQELIEEMSAMIHEMWAGWIKHTWSNMSIENILRWQKQADTPYADLTEKEKSIDREFTHKLMKLMLLHGYDMQGLGALLNNADANLNCPKCGYSGAFVVHSAPSYEEGPVDLKCPDCGHIFDPEKAKGV